MRCLSHADSKGYSDGDSTLRDSSCACVRSWEHFFYVLVQNEKLPAALLSVPSLYIPTPVDIVVIGEKSSDILCRLLVERCSRSRVPDPRKVEGFSSTFFHAAPPLVGFPFTIWFCKLSVSQDFR